MSFMRILALSAGCLAFGATVLLSGIFALATCSDENGNSGCFSLFTFFVGLAFSLYLFHFAFV